MSEFGLSTCHSQFMIPVEILTNLILAKNISQIIWCEKNIKLLS